jgi:hypothetical protein
MLRIEPLGTDVFLPAFVVGYEIPDGAAGAIADRALDRLPPEPGPLLVLDQQAGGYCMTYPSVAGVVLRLEANDGKARAPLKDLVRGLKAMAEDPDKPLLAREFPVLSELVHTRGDPYDKQDLRQLQSFVQRFIDTPPLESGLEAFVRFGPCDVLSYFGGWNVLSCRLVEPDRRRGSICGDDPPTRYCVEEGNVSDLLCDDRRVLDESLLQSVSHLGRQLGLEGSPRLFLLWENSD